MKHRHVWRQPGNERGGQSHHRADRRRELLENADVVGKYFRGKLEELPSRYSLIGDVRGMGLMQGLELVKDRKTKEPASRSHHASDGARPARTACSSARAASTATPCASPPC